MSVSELASSPVESPGLPFAYGVDGRPVSRQEAKELLADVELRTVHKTDLKLATGDWATVRTLALVFDPDAWSGLVSPHYRPHLWGTALYTPAPENALLEVLCTYDDRDLAVEEHKLALAMVAVGTNSEESEPRWASELSWTGPER
ncbi:hypothetical protein ACFVXC_05620 [Streptomyces sp. NPDC058257]|uniref:hypothetical protein n=1 Tax=Streptomyces sp. NPDC058257 TaxID=3346409 RepID=UPI0036E1B599